MRTILFLGTILFSGPALGEVTCVVQGGYLVCNTLDPIAVAVSTPTMSPADPSTPDYSSEASYRMAAAYPAAGQADPAALYAGAVANPYESLDTTDSFGSTTGTVCMYSSDPDSGC